MELARIREGLIQGGHYSAWEDDGILIIRDLENGSEYSLEEFDQSAQIRQAVWLGCDQLPDEELSRIYVLCSMMNARFSGCKSYVDQWGALTTAADILGPGIETDFIEVLLGQIEFISQALFELAEKMHAEKRLVSSCEIDSALELPSLQ